MIKEYDKIGEVSSFGGITIELCAMPRRMDRAPPRGEPYYPFKVGYRFKNWDEYTSIHDVYRLVQWQLLFEKKVRFLDEDGNLCAVKDNSHWEKDHLIPLKQILKIGESELSVDVARLLKRENQGHACLG